jgi:hypothetical protein
MIPMSDSKQERLCELAHDLEHLSFIDSVPHLYGDPIGPRQLMDLLRSVRDALLEAAK